MKDTLVYFFHWLRRNSRLFISWFILYSLFILFQDRISDLIAHNTIIGIREIDNKNFSVLFTILLVLIFSIFLYLFFKNYRLSRNLNFWIFFIGATYYILKMDKSDNLIFLSSENEILFFIKHFSDLILVISFFTLILFVRNLFGDFRIFDWLIFQIDKNLKLKGKNKSNSIYKEDIPLKGEEIQDSERIIRILTEQINQLQPYRAFIIGINGEWGNGKTSFLNNLEYKIKFSDIKLEKSPITFWFNAWQHQNEKSIINNFFSQLKKELSKYSGDAKTSINRYLSSLLAVFGSNFSKGINFLSEDLLSSDLTIKDYYESLNNIITRIDRKVIVFVDDLDRLNKSEIIEVLRILRNVANFKNTIFVCGFDKEYLIRTGEFEINFLDKIFNLEINLPKLHQNGLLIYFKYIVSNSGEIRNTKEICDTFESLFDTDVDNPFEFDVLNLVNGESNTPIEDNQLISIPLSPSLFFETRRDVKRFYNSLMTDLNILENIEDVDLQEYILFKLLIFKYSWIQNLFDNKRINLWLGNESVLKLNLLKFKHFYKRDDIESVDLYTIYTVFQRLFPSTSEDNYFEKSGNINQRRYLPIYLNNNVFNQSFSYKTLVVAHQDLKIDELIEDKIIGLNNESYILNDIKSFLLKEDNLKTFDEFRQAVAIIKKYSSKTITNFEIIKLIHIGEQKNGFLEFAHEELFTSFEDIFGDLLVELNIYYTRFPKDESFNQDNIDIFFTKNNKSELDIVNASFVKAKLNELYNDYIATNPDFEIAKDRLLLCTQMNFHYFDIYFLNVEATEVYKDLLKNNFRKIFLLVNPIKLVEIFSIEFIAAVFATVDMKNNIITEVKKMLKSRDSFSGDDLNKTKFHQEGWKNFIEFILVSSKSLKLNESENENLSYLISFIRLYSKKNFIIPTKQDVVLNRTIEKLKGKRDN